MSEIKKDLKLQNYLTQNIRIKKKVSVIDLLTSYFKNDSKVKYLRERLLPLFLDFEIDNIFNSLSIFRKKNRISGATPSKLPPLKSSAKGFLELPFYLIFLITLFLNSCNTMTGEIENRYGEKFRVPNWIYALLGRSVQISENLEDKTNYPINGLVSSTDGTNYARHTIAVVGHSESTTTTDDRGNFTIKVPPGNYLVSVTNSSGSEVGKFRLVIARGGGVSLQSLSGGFSVTANGVTGVRPNEVAKPVFDPVEGSYSSDQSISITSATSGVTIYYTTDGTDPNISSNLYSSAIPVSGSGTSITIKAIAILDRKRFSPISSGSFTINYNQVSTPTFNVASGTYNSDQSITITTATSGATIYYTTDGSTPTTGSTQYSSAISVAGNGTSMTIKAIAVKSGMTDSGVASGSYVIAYPVSPPVFSNTGGTFFFAGSPTVTITSATSGATIYYTIDGSTPTTSSSVYSTGLKIIQLGEIVTLKAIATGGGFSDSLETSATYYHIAPLLKTGQTTIYRTNDDGTYQKGATRSYTDNGDGTITDNVTGLIWQKCSMGQNNDSTCSGTATRVTWTDAVSYCENLSLGGQADWRLPGKKQYETIYDWGNSSGSINSSYFPNTARSYINYEYDYYWTSSKVGSGSLPWLGYHSSYYAGMKYRNGNNYVVR
ncbi:MAG: chitobiase/beta-hexosaminidase C-terminal domain-containing protein, partial [Leptospiraceae bacterium]|nr:chitobiase/beta-hexosaminidase C-terminal domain-containing protein [Leptospiraceae bacterium]